MQHWIAKVGAPPGVRRPAAIFNAAIDPASDLLSDTDLDHEPAHDH